MALGHGTFGLGRFGAGPFEVGTRWGVYDDVLCPGERTFTFLENVLTEVMALFPGKYVHVGGDEAPKFRWHDSPAAQAVMRRHGLASEDELQRYFMKRIEQLLVSPGRRLIGWGEILPGGLPPQAAAVSARRHGGGAVLVVCNRADIAALVEALSGLVIGAPTPRDLYVVTVPRYGPAKVLRMTN